VVPIMAAESGRIDTSVLRRMAKNVLIGRKTPVRADARSAHIYGRFAILAEVRLFASELRLDELERGHGLARQPIP
jgi:hypothetical protein